MSVRVPVGTDSFTIVDEEDAPLVALYRWALRGEYVSRTVRRDGRKHPLYLHRWLVEAPAGMDVDHINGDARDNRRCNLRVVTRKQNQENRGGAHPSSKTGVRGVRWEPGRQRYVATVYSNGKRAWMGRFKTLREANMAVVSARSRIFTHADRENEVW